MENQKNDVKGALKASRRQLLIKSAKVAPAITAIAAAPVWATGNANSSHQSAGISSTSRITRFNGFSPGYFHEHKNKGPKRSRSSARLASNDNECQTSKGGSKLPDFYYDKFYGGIGGIFPGSLLAAQVRDVLSPSNWTKGGETANINGHSVTQVDRFMLTAYLNADPLYGASGYPYTQEEIRNFCRDYEQGRVSYTDAKLILTNLIHEGQEDMSWEADTVC